MSLFGASFWQASQHLWNHWVPSGHPSLQVRRMHGRVVFIFVCWTCLLKLRCVTDGQDGFAAEEGWGVVNVTPRRSWTLLAMISLRISCQDFDMNHCLHWNTHFRSCLKKVRREKLKPWLFYRFAAFHWRQKGFLFHSDNVSCRVFGCSLTLAKSQW